VLPPKLVLLFAGLALTLQADVHNLTLAQALELAARENPEVLLARLDQQRSQDDVRIAQSPFRPKVTSGAGIAYTYGYPNSIDGSAPSLFQARTDMALFNRPESYRLSAARELARGSQYGAQAKAEDAAYRTADLFLAATQSAHVADTLDQEIPTLEKVDQTMQAAVSGGSELPIEAKRATLNLAMARERAANARLDVDYGEMMLAIVLGYPAADRVHPVESDALKVDAPTSETEAADQAIRNNRELRQMQSSILAKQLDLRSYKSERLPQVGLVAQYALFDKQNYQQYFQKFQANNVQLGASITIPLLVGPAGKASADQAAIDMEKLRVQVQQVRNRIISDTRRSYQQWEKANNIRDLARMQLDLARESLSVLLAQNAEGRVPLRQLEEARVEESDRWIALYDAEADVLRAKFAILRQMGTLLSSVRDTGAHDTGARP
jgi:outer membrane protein TolC